MIDKERLAQKCSTWNIDLTPTQLDLLDRYAALLVDYNLSLIHILPQRQKQTISFPQGKRSGRCCAAGE